jgi:23S rRNA pseudouridine955/2504/2580 synthase
LGIDRPASTPLCRTKPKRIVAALFKCFKYKGFYFHLDAKRGCMEKVSWVEIDTEYAGQRVDNYLITHLKGVPKSHIYRILRKGEVRANGGRIKPHYRLKVGDKIRIPPIRISDTLSPATVNTRLAQRLEAAILYEDDDLIVMNKPSGLAVHGGSGVNLGVIEMLRVLRPSQAHLELVHRLDRDTSGCLLIAKKRSRLRQLHELLRNNMMEKTYIALVSGHWPKRKQQVNAPLLKNELKSGERYSRVSAEGKDAVTKFRVLDTFPDATLVEARPVTGRTHQIRAHAQYAGHPIIGDTRYGDEAVNKMMRGRGVKRLFLHAIQIRIPGDGLRSGVELTVSAPLDPELQAVLDRRLE